MKLILLILSIFFSLQCFGQKWHLNSVDQTSDYGYEYWFQFENSDDTSSYQLIKKSGKQISTFELFDSQGDKVIFANIRLKNLETDSTIYLSSDLEGKANIKLEKGRYTFEVSTIKYDRLDFEFEIDKNQFIELKIYLGLAPDLTVYQIHSKTELNKLEIRGIMDCVKKNRNEYYQTCSDKGKYLIMMHI